MKFIICLLLIFLSLKGVSQKNNEMNDKGKKIIGLGLVSAHNYELNKQGLGIGISYFHFLSNKIASQLQSSFLIYPGRNITATQFNLQGAIAYFPVQKFYIGINAIGITYYSNFRVNNVSNSGIALSLGPEMGVLLLQKKVNLEASYISSSDIRGKHVLLSLRYNLANKEN